MIDSLWQVPGLAAIIALYIFAKRSPLGACCGLLILYFSLHWAFSFALYQSQGHYSDIDYDAHWMAFIALDAAFCLLLWLIRAPMLTLELFLLAIVYGCWRAQLAPGGDIEQQAENYYLYCYLVWVAVTVYSVSPRSTVDRSTAN